MTALVDWVARDQKGRTLTRAEFVGTSNLPRHSVREMIVQTDAGRVRALLDPTKGETIRVFTRRSISAEAGSTLTPGETADTVVIEIAPDPDRPDRFVRLYLGREVLLSTEDFYG